MFIQVVQLDARHPPSSAQDCSALDDTSFLQEKLQDRGSDVTLRSMYSNTVVSLKLVDKCFNLCLGRDRQLQACYKQLFLRVFDISLDIHRWCSSPVVLVRIASLIRWFSFHVHVHGGILPGWEPQLDFMPGTRFVGCLSELSTCLAKCKALSHPSDEYKIVYIIYGKLYIMYTSWN